MLFSLLLIYLGLCVMVVVLENRLVYPAPRSTTWQTDAPSIEEVWFQSADGTRLHGVYFAYPNARCTLLYLHGNGEDVSYNIDYMNQLRGTLEASILIFDYRGYGKSEGSPYESGVIEDGLAAQTWLAERTGIAPSEIVIWGRSLGGGVAIAVAEKLGAKALLLENTFHDMSEVAADKFPWLPVRWLMRNRYRSIDRIKNCNCPVIQTHGTYDQVVPFAMGKQLFQAIPTPQKQFFPVEGGGHNDATSQVFLDAVNEFLETLN